MRIIFFTLFVLLSVEAYSYNDSGIDHPSHATSYTNTDLIIGSEEMKNNVEFYSKTDVLQKNKPKALIVEKTYNGVIPKEKVIISKGKRNYNQTLVQEIEQSIEASQQAKVVNIKNPDWHEQKPDFLYKDGFYMIQSDWKTIEGFFHEDWKSVVDGYQNICKVTQNKQDLQPVASSSITIGNAKDLKNICYETQSLQQANDEEKKMYFYNNFLPYLVGDDENITNFGTFTGYYYPTLNASRTKTWKYKYPIYKKPLELKNGDKYYTRKEINDGILNGKGLEIFWVDDFVDLYFLHIQGSGMLKLPDGSYAHVKFSAKNNQPYESMGKYMLSKGYVTKGSDIKDYLKAHEDIAHDILSVNSSYIFFAENNEESVIGAHGSELVDGRSLAVDNTFIPYGLMLFIDSKNHSKVMFAQDTGSAIKGKIRGDIFTGKGEAAGDVAKRTHEKGIMYVMVHKNQNLELR